jgi:subtilisin
MKRHMLLFVMMLASFAMLTGCVQGFLEGPQEAADVPSLWGQGTQNGAQVRDQFIVGLKPGTDPRAAASEIAAQHRGRVLYVYTTALLGFALRVPAAAIASIQRDPRVEFIEPDRIFTIDVQSLPTGINRIEADKNPHANINQADDVGINYDVVVFDTGIDQDHPDLNVAGGRNFSGGSVSNWDDGNGHGTHVAGTIGAKDNGSGVVGVAPGVRLWAFKVCKNGGICLSSERIAGLDEATACKLKALGGSTTCNVKAEGINFASANMSIGTPDDDTACHANSDALHKAICSLVNAGVVFSLSAGNEGVEKKAYPEVLAVSALADFDGKAGGAGSPTCRSDEDDTLANFSNFGPALDIAAPGVCILSTWNSTTLTYLEAREVG